MSEELVAKKLETSLRTKTLTDLIRVRVGEDVTLLIDVSGSMADRLNNNKTRIDSLGEVVRDIQSKRRCKMIAFGGRDGGAYEVTSAPTHAGGGTPLHEAIRLARLQKVGRCIVISDGQPDNASMAMSEAREFGGQIDVVFVGNPGEYGEEFLKQLAAATGGTEFHGDLSQPKELSGKIMGLLNAGTDLEDE